MDLLPNKSDAVLLPITNTRISASEWNQLVGSCMAFISAAGFSPDAADNEQFLNAFKKIASELELIGANTALSNLTEEGANISNWSSNVSNCITNIPQDIKLEINNGIMTLKAGSKVYVPNGFETDGVTPKFDVVTVNSDVSGIQWGTITASNIFEMYNPSNNGITPWEFSYSGSTAPTQTFCVWYDTTNNLVKWTTDGGATWESGMALPLSLSNYSNGLASSIEKVFNGFGYIGSTIFALPGVKCLIPNGRNADGSLNNIEATVTSVSTQTYPSNYNLFDFHICIGSNGQIATGNNEYVENRNILRNLGQTLQILYCQVGIVSATNGVIKSFTTKTPFHALDYSDREIISGWSMPSGAYKDLTLSASGATYIAPANGYFYLGKQSTVAGQIIDLYNQSCKFRLQSNTNKAGEYCLVYIPAATNDVVQVNYTVNGATEGFRFIYAKGSAN